VNGDFHILAQTLIEGVDEEYLLCALKFKTFENMNQKLWPNMLFFFLEMVSLGRSKKITFLKNKNLELVC